MPIKSTTDVMFSLRVFMEKHREGQKELHYVFVDLEKAYNRAPREELWYWMRKSVVVEQYVGGEGHDEDSKIVVKCAVGVTSKWCWDYIREQL